MNSVDSSTAKPSVIGIFTSPIVQFQRIKDTPLVVIPLFILIAISLIASGLIAYIPDYSAVIQMTLEQGLDTSNEFAEAMEVFTRLIVFISGLFVPVFISLLPAFIFWVVGKVLGSMVSFKQLFSMMLYVSLIVALGSLFNSIVVVLFNLDPMTVVTGVSMLFDPLDPLAPLLSFFDIFNIWYIILTALGLGYVAGFNKGAAWSLPIVLSLITAFIAYLTSGIQ
ncbi:YIP1 family protein [Alkalicoccobacillus porphyridii]|uniref:YIP1 family protein n=1 Tax=Alkalicoccobacillus porphyridii TaxID=2597270 RepID=UPI00163D957D|nr:YIP1 family protein [Alkalicoccobacillus porphyridii]